jgi:hypothetical protein
MYSFSISMRVPGQSTAVGPDAAVAGGGLSLVVSDGSEQFIARNHHAGLMENN